MGRSLPPSAERGTEEHTDGGCAEDTASFSVTRGASPEGQTPAGPQQRPGWTSPRGQNWAPSGGFSQPPPSRVSCFGHDREPGKAKMRLSPPPAVSPSSGHGCDPCLSPGSWHGSRRTGGQSLLRKPGEPRPTASLPLLFCTWGAWGRVRGRMPGGPEPDAQYPGSAPTTSPVCCQPSLGGPAQRERRWVWTRGLTPPHVPPVYLWPPGCPGDSLPKARLNFESCFGDGLEYIKNVPVGDPRAGRGAGTWGPRCDQHPLPTAGVELWGAW